MKRIHPVRLLCVLTILVIGGASRAEPPSVIVIVADDLGYGELGCYGQRRIETPNIDRLAADGIRFTQFYSGQAVCAPSRCALLTGKHMGHAAIRDNGNPPERGRPNVEEDYFPGQHPLPDKEVTLAELLKARGYSTAVVGKWGLGNEASVGHPLQQGFDRFFGYLCQVHAHNHYPRFLWSDRTKISYPENRDPARASNYSQDRIAEEALSFIRENRDRPFFLYLTPAIPHLAIQAPPEAVAQYVGKIPEEEHKHTGSYPPHPTPRAGYAAMVSYLDKDVGRIRSLLDELGLTESTLIFFTSDNGPTHGRVGGADSEFFESNGPLRGLKGSLWEGGIRVPMIVSWPDKLAAGATNDHVATFWDLLPTICEATGASPPQGIDGLSFYPALVGAEQKRHDHLYWEFPSYGGQQAVRMGKWKAIRRNLQERPDASFKLFDLEADRGETRDLARDHPEVIAEVERIARESRRPSTLFPFPALDE